MLLYDALKKDFIPMNHCFKEQHAINVKDEHPSSENLLDLYNALALDPSDKVFQITLHEYIPQISCFFACRNEKDTYVYSSLFLSASEVSQSNARKMTPGKDH